VPSRVKLASLDEMERWAIDNEVELLLNRDLLLRILRLKSEAVHYSSRDWWEVCDAFGEYGGPEVCCQEGVGNVSIEDSTTAQSGVDYST
jgi:hypothetical protein